MIDSDESISALSRVCATVLTCGRCVSVWWWLPLFEILRRGGAHDDGRSLWCDTQDQELYHWTKSRSHLTNDLAPYSRSAVSLFDREAHRLNNSECWGLCNMIINRYLLAYHQVWHHIILAVLTTRMGIHWQWGLHQIRYRSLLLRIQPHRLRIRLHPWRCIVRQTCLDLNP